MAGSRVFQFVLLMSCVIFSTDALTVFLTDGKDFRSNRGFNYETRINFHYDSGLPVYDGCNLNQTYMPRDETTKVIVYIKSYDLMKRTTLRKKCGAKRIEISDTLREHSYEMLYMGVYCFNPGDERLIAEFLLQSINIIYFQINIIAEKNVDLIYKTTVHELDKYEEEPDVYGGRLQEELRSMDK